MQNHCLTIVEPICYLHPHKEEIVYSHPSMMTVWRESFKLTKKSKQAFFSPLLVDDLKREGSVCDQTVDQILSYSIGRSYEKLPWFGDAVMESDIEKQYGNLGCKLFDSLYHRDVLLSVVLLDRDWFWTAVHPITFKEQQAGMLLDLFKLVYEKANFASIAMSEQKKTEDVRKEAKNSFLSHFSHEWINLDGTIESFTRPVYAGGKIIHKKYETIR